MFSFRFGQRVGGKLCTPEHHGVLWVIAISGWMIFDCINFRDLGGVVRRLVRVLDRSSVHILCVVLSLRSLLRRDDHCKRRVGVGMVYGCLLGRIDRSEAGTAFIHEMEVKSQTLIYLLSEVKLLREDLRGCACQPVAAEAWVALLTTVSDRLTYLLFDL